MLFTKPINTPVVSMLLLIIISLACSLTLQGIVMFIFAVYSGSFDVLKSGASIMSNPVFSNLLLAVSSISTFGLPAYFLLQAEQRQINYFPVQRRGRLTYLVLVLFTMIACIPLMSQVAEWNAKMVLPDSLKGIESWMREQEDSAASMMSGIVMKTSWWGLIINLIILAILPGICEELFFRGVIQTSFFRLFKNQHLAIWVTAIIFSAIHVQFYGFFPRMLLGAFFGYLLIWSNNIWVPIFGHFINNATATIFGFYYSREGKTFKEMSTAEVYPWYIYIGSIAATMVLLFILYNYSRKVNDGKRLGKDQDVYKCDPE
ncbi:CPBP family glutamic-type intramembrane protease [Sphingobacterium spiritivorum]|uniref:CPBP family glutamic-type intramembrane protease n=1 Tax=Sphingobacterium spiritivorum TaxID=258 RepID=UPI003DA633E9